MNLSLSARALMRSIMAGVVVLSGLSACSRSDRADTGRDTTQSGAAMVAPTDTGNGPATQPSTGTATQPSSDTAMTSATGNEAVSGYRAMERDTAAADTASAEMAGAASPTDSAGAATNSEMARDTSSAAGTGDTAAVAVTDSGIAAEADTTGNIQVQVDTTSTQQAQADTTMQAAADTVALFTSDSAGQDNSRAAAGAVVAAGAAASGDNADVSRDNGGRVRPPEDSTEILGNVTTDSAAAGNGDVASRSESDRIRPPEDSSEVHGNVTSDNDRAEATSDDAETGAVGAAAMDRTVTGADAVALMSRAGEQCILLNEESTEAAWDISDSPANLNPCGPGTMTLSPVRTGEGH